MQLYEYKIENTYYSTDNINDIPEGVSYNVVPVVEVPEDIEAEYRYQTKQRYERHKADGWEYYQYFRAGMVWDIERGVLTIQQAFVIENYLSTGYDKIAQNGDWMTASYKLKLITLPEQHAFVQSYLDSAIEIIDDYIDKNYPKR